MRPLRESREPLRVYVGARISMLLVQAPNRVAEISRLFDAGGDEHICRCRGRAADSSTCSMRSRAQ